MQKAPRDYAGQKSTPLSIFMDDYAYSLCRGKDVETSTAKRVLDRVTSYCYDTRDPPAIDLGSFQKIMKDDVITELQKIALELGKAQKSLDGYADAFEDILDFKFPGLEIAQRSSSTPFSAQLVTKSLQIKSSSRTSRYEAAEKEGLGAMLLRNGTLDRVKLKMKHFPNIVTPNPEACTVQEWEVHYIVEVLYEIGFCCYGRAHLDLIWCKHLGAQARGLFPRLPDRGQGKKLVLGQDREFTAMLKDLAQNWRKASAVRAMLDRSDCFDIPILRYHPSPWAAMKNRFKYITLTVRDIANSRASRQAFTQFKSHVVFEDIDLCDAARELVKPVEEGGMGFPVKIGHASTVPKFNFFDEPEEAVPAREVLKEPAPIGKAAAPALNLPPHNLPVAMAVPINPSDAHAVNAANVANAAMQHALFSTMYTEPQNFESMAKLSNPLSSIVPVRKLSEMVPAKKPSEILKPVSLSAANELMGNHGESPPPPPGAFPGETYEQFQQRGMAYEKKREDDIAKNKRKLVELGLGPEEVEKPKKRPPRPKTKKPEPLTQPVYAALKRLPVCPQTSACALKPLPSLMCLLLHSQRVLPTVSSALRSLPTGSPLPSPRSTITSPATATRSTSRAQSSRTPSRPSTATATALTLNTSWARSRTRSRRCAGFSSPASSCAPTLSRARSTTARGSL